jgi:imidazole glycerol-phosphate synthase subunit HisH
LAPSVRRWHHWSGWISSVRCAITRRAVRFEAGSSEPGARRLKVPEVGWNRIAHPGGNDTEAWSSSLLAGLPDGAFMYFVHSFYAVPQRASDILSRSRYGDTEFCSSFARGNLFGCQFHPERSGAGGLKIYDNLAHAIRSRHRQHANSI